MRTILPLVLFVSLAMACFSQQQNQVDLPPNGRLKVYLDGEVEDFNYLRRTITYVDFVQDPNLSDVQVVATRLVLGSGGRKYYLAFYSGKERNQPDFKLTFIRNPGDTDDLDRVRFGKTLAIGLMNYLSETDAIDRIQIGLLADSDNKIDQKAEMDDPWNNWVFRLTGTGGWDLEESKTNISYSGSVKADRITDTWMMRNYLSHKNSTRTYKQTNGDIYRSVNIVDQAYLRTIYAINNHWSAGVFLKSDRSTYLNTDFDVSFKPAIEYNFFDWKDADHKIFTLAYHVGPAYYKYRDTTFLNRTTDFLWEHNLEVALEMVQPWGEIDVQLGYEGYLNDLANYNLGAEADISVRVWKGLSVYFELTAESIHNQLYLPKEEVSLEELLLDSRKLPTSYEFGGEVGLRFYFGSIYNNIVNERL